MAVFLAFSSSYPGEVPLFVLFRRRRLSSREKKNMGDSLELIGKRLFLLLDDGSFSNGSETEHAVRSQDWLRGTVRAVSVMGLAAPEVSGGEATTTPAAGLTVSVYIRVLPRCILEKPSYCTRAFTYVTLNMWFNAVQLV